jgi:hypothetical protein
MTVMFAVGPHRPAVFSPEEVVRAKSWLIAPAGPFPLSPEATAPNGVRVADRFDVPLVEQCMRYVPARLLPLVRVHYENLWKTQSRRAANLWAQTVGDTLGQGRAGVAASEEEVKRTAAARAEEVARMLERAVIASADVVRGQLVELLGRWCIPEPDKVTLAGLCARMTSQSWWRRKLRVHVGRNVEGFARDVGAVHRRAGVYVSEDANHRHQQRQRNARRFFSESEVLNMDTGEALPMSDVVSTSLSNPALRRTELMVRMRGFEEWAQSQGHVGMFYTITTPSKFHARNHDGSENEKYSGATPRDGQAYLCDVWARFRAWSGRNAVFVYGIRVAEPHHDGTPHWHILLFMRRQDVERVTDRLKSLSLIVDGSEPGAAKHRFEAVAIDPEKGSAAGYLAKYIAKNIDGHAVGDDDEAGAPAETTADRTRAWASTWGIRQFQQIGGPGVGVWRELRRLRARPRDQVIAPIWEAADAAEWRAYVERMGGTECRRKDRPLSIWTVAPPGRCNQYQEPAAPRVKGVSRLFGCVITRLHEWSIRRGFGVSRTRGNNCTATVTGGHREPPQKTPRWHPPSLIGG